MTRDVGHILGAVLITGIAPALSLPNPAAVLCEKDGATIEIKRAANGGEIGICVFPGGTRIDEWAYFRNKHRTKN